MTNKKSIELLYEQWRTFTNVLNTAILNACTQSNYIKQTFQNEYPKLLKLTNDLWLRLLQLSSLIDRYRYTSANQSQTSSGDKAAKSTSLAQISSSSTVSAVGSFVSAYDLLRKCFQELENSYLNRSLSHLFDPINLIFSQGIEKPVNRNDIESFVRGISR